MWGFMSTVKYKKKAIKAKVKVADDGNNSKRKERKERLRKTKALISRESAGDRMLHDQGGRGTNPLAMASHTTTKNSNTTVVPATDMTMDVSCALSDRSLYYLSMGIVLRAIKKGWLGAVSANGSGQPYYAFIYLYNCFNNALKGDFPTIQQAPRWFWEIIHALRPKTEPFKTGKIAYQMAVADSGAPTSPLFPLAAQGAYSVFWGTSSPTVLVSGWNGLIAPDLNQSPYTDAQGAVCAQAMFGFFADDGLSTRGPDPGEDAYLRHDTSAFAMCYSEQGSSYFSPGGLSILSYSERDIQVPLLSKLVTYQGTLSANSVGQWRGIQHGHKSAGTACYIGPRLSELSGRKQLYNKKSPVFKFYNLDEFCQRLAFTVSLAVESELRNPNLSGGVYQPCPLTYQEFCIVVRQALLPYFYNEMAQDLQISSGGNSPVVSMFPLVVGPNGCSVTSSTDQPLFPKFFTESVRAVSRYQFTPKGSSGEIDYIPVLALPAEASGITNYSVSVEENVYDVFGAVDGDPVINLIDASTTQGNNSYYLDFNGTQLTYQIAEWNKWIKTLTFLTGLSTLGTEDGITALNLNAYTAHQRTQIPETQVATVPTAPGKSRRASVKGPLIIGKPPRKVAGIKQVNPTGADYFKDVGTTSFTSNVPFTSAIWKYAQHMTLPCYWTEAQVDEGSLGLYQANAIEPYNISTSLVNAVYSVDTEVYPVVYNQHLSSALLDIRPAINSGKSEMEVDLDALGAMGRGGFFTDLAATLGDAFGIPAVGGVARAIGSVTGW